MQSKTKDQPSHLNHSFLFWLFIPVLMIWLTFGYVLGFIKDKPKWYVRSQPLPLSKIVPLMKENNILENLQGKSYITLWFDDAWQSQYSIAFPLLKSYGYLGTIAIPTKSIETPNYMSWEHVRLLQESGWEITNHSSTHDCNMNKWDQQQVETEFKSSRLELWKNGLTSDIFVTPCGVDSPVMRSEMTKFFLGFRTVNPGINDLDHLDFYNLKIRNIDNQTSLQEVESWIEEVTSSNSWLILVFHKIGENTQEVGEEKYNISLSDTKMILEFIKGSRAEVVTPRQILFSTLK